MTIHAADLSFLWYLVCFAAASARVFAANIPDAFISFVKHRAGRLVAAVSLMVFIQLSHSRLTSRRSQSALPLAVSGVAGVRMLFVSFMVAYDADGSAFFVMPHCALAGFGV